MVRHRFSAGFQVKIILLYSEKESLTVTTVIIPPRRKKVIGQPFASVAKYDTFRICYILGQTAFFVHCGKPYESIKFR